MGGGRRRPLLFAGTLLLLAGCSGTPFGDQLAGSFSDPATPATPAAAPAAPAPSPAAPANPQPAPTAAEPAPEPKPPAAALQPAPYRVTLKLPSADPAAPAEVVTQALRAAGVSFEVEMIERVNPAAAPAPAAPVATPAPAPR